MSQVFRQICYTRLGSTAVDAGWQICNQDPGISGRLRELFEQEEAANQSTDDGALLMLEVNAFSGNAGFAGLTRITYGQTDQTGRQIYFSHGFVAEQAYEILKDPNRLLGISSSNFRATPEETAVIPTEVVYDPPRSAAKIWQKYGLTAERYAALLKCAYYCLMNSAQMEVYIRTDGSQEMMRDLLYLIYEGIPYSLRPRISAATSSTRVKRMFIFTDKVPREARQLDFGTGANNVLTPEFERKLSGYPFALFAPTGNPTDPRNAYYDGLEAVMGQLGKRESADLQALRLSHQVCAYQADPRGATDGEVMDVFYNWMRSADYTAGLPLVKDLMSEIVRRGTILSDNEGGLLKDWITASGDRDLKELHFKYSTQVLMRQDKAASYHYLDTIRGNRDLVNRIVREMTKTEEGKRFLHGYYVQYADTFFRSIPKKYADVETFCATCADTSVLKAHENDIVGACREIAMGEIHRGMDFFQTAGRLTDALKTMKIEGDVNRLAGGIGFDLASEYDRMFDRSFDIGKLDAYRSFYDRYKAQFPDSHAFLNAVCLMRDGEYEKVADYLGQLILPGDQPMPLREEDRARVSRLLEIGTGYEMNLRCFDMDLWEGFAYALQEDVAELMTAHRAAILSDDQRLERVMATDPYWSDYEYVSKFHGALEAWLKKNQNQDVVLRGSWSLITAQLGKLEKERKSQKKEKEKAARAKLKEEAARQKRETAEANGKKQAGANEKTPAEPDGKKGFIGFVTDLADGVKNIFPTKKDNGKPKK